MQKGFLNGVQGCTQHALTLSSLIQMVRRKKHAAHILFLDIANAFGSVPHSLLVSALESIHAPQWLSDYVGRFYSGIKVIGTTQHYRTEPYDVNAGVFQGDTMSPTLFLLVFRQCLMYLETEKSYGIAFKEEPIVSLAFADDLTLVCRNPKTAQRIMTNLSNKMEKMNLFLKPAKCCSLSLKSGSFDRTRTFSLQGQEIGTIADSPMKFLGSMVYPKHQKSKAADHLEGKLSSLMRQVDSLPLRGSYKAQIYSDYVSACMRFDLSVHDISQTKLHDLDVLVNTFIRRWFKMPRSTHIGFVLHSKGLDIPQPSELYRVGHASVLTSANHQDRIFQEAIEDKMLNPSNSALQQDIIDLATASSTKGQMKKMASALKDSKVEAAARECSKQGCAVELLDVMDSDQSWNSCLLGLSQPTYCFLLNSMSDSLPTNCNLKLWNKTLSSHCKACDAEKETLLHVLNACPRMLDRYKWRHDNVLNLLHEFVCESYKDNADVDVLCDLVISNGIIQSDQCQQTIPDSVYLTAERPDLVIFNRSRKRIVILELTIPFEQNFQKAYTRKADRYKALVAGIEERDISCDYFSVEIGSRGIVHQGTSAILREITGAQRREVKERITKLSKCAIKCSYVIFRDRHNLNSSLSYIMQ